MPSILIYSKLNNQSSCSVTRQLPLPFPGNIIPAVPICTCTDSEHKIARTSDRISALCMWEVAPVYTHTYYSFWAGI